MYYTSRLSYEQQGDRIIALCTAAFTVKESVEPFYFASVTATITFTDSGFDLRDIKISPWDSE
jgi:hypothetical protein